MEETPDISPFVENIKRLATEKYGTDAHTDRAHYLARYLQENSCNMSPCNKRDRAIEWGILGAIRVEVRKMLAHAETEVPSITLLRQIDLIGRYELMGEDPDCYPMAST